MIDASRSNHAVAPQLTRRSASWVAIRRRQDELGSIGLFPFAGSCAYAAVPRQVADGRRPTHRPLLTEGVDGRHSEHGKQPSEEDNMYSLCINVKRSDFCFFLDYTRTPR